MLCGALLVLGGLLLPPGAAWDPDLELLDLVEEIPQTFYRFLSLDQDASAADIKKAFRRLSLLLHPDKNRDPDAETQFRQLVAIYEVLKDEERRRRYDDILLHGLPDWRQPVFYYRRVRRLSNAELGALLFLILTVGHYAVIWSIYLEKQLDELLSRKKKEKKKKLSSRPEEPRCPDRDQDRPHWQDILPLKLSIWLYLSIQSLPQTVQELRRFYEAQQQRRQQEAEAQQEAPTREKRPKVKKPKAEFPVYQDPLEDPVPPEDLVPQEDLDPPEDLVPLEDRVPPEDLACRGYDQTTSIQDIEEQMDDWLEERRAKKKAADWTEEDLSLLSRLMVKFPGGTPGRWEKIAQDLDRPVAAVTAKVRQVKDSVSPPSGSRCGAEGAEPEAPPPRGRRPAGGAGGAELRVRGRRQRDFDPSALEEEEPDRHDDRGRGGAGGWTQNQQRLLELALTQFPRGTPERWDRIAKVVPGRTKEDCMTRYKMLAELVQKKKQTKDSTNQTQS